MYQDGTAHAFARGLLYSTLMPCVPGCAAFARCLYFTLAQHVHRTQSLLSSEYDLSSAADFSFMASAMWHWMRS